MTAIASDASASGATFETVVRQYAALVPAVVIAYSLVIDPLINLQPVTDSGLGGADQIEKSTLLAQLLIPVLFVSLAFLSTIVYPRRWQALLPVLVPLVAFLCFALVSATWSPAPARSFMLATYQSVLCALLALSIAMSGDPLKIFRNILWVFAVAMAINLLFVVMRPPGSIGHQGIYPYKNTLGGAAACALIVALAHIGNRGTWIRFSAVAVSAIAVIVLVASESKTAIALAVFAPAAAFGVLYLSPRLNANAMLVMAIAGGAIVSASVVAAQIWLFTPDDLLRWMFGDPTFTGRTNIWAFIYSHITEAPAFGHGYRGFWGIGELSPKLHSEIEFIRATGSSHNGFLDIALDTGLVGLLLLTAFIVSTLWSATRASNGRGAAFLFLSIALFVLGRNMMESVLLWSSFFDNLLFVLAGLSAAYLASERKTAQPYLDHLGGRTR
ncbi:MAG: O-antigen ligase family protein [Roseibium sp.]|nr:O-antigen ligase family protein [Roseibium sp.]